MVLPDSAESTLPEIRRALRRKLSDVPMTVDLVLATEGHLAQFGGSVNSIYCHILKEGTVAYEQHASDASADSGHQSR